MNASKKLFPLFGAALFVASANAQVMTEVRISTSGDDEEYVEILMPTAPQSTDGLMILVVEGDPSGATGGEGTLDAAYDLTGDTATDIYYVVGSSTAGANATFGAEIDNTTFGDNMFENSSMTLYLVNVPDANLRFDITTWVTTDIRMPAGSTTTRITMTPGIEVLDAVAFNDGDSGDVFFDNAPVFGPDGPFLPSGIFRPGGCPSDWCSDEFVNFGTDGMNDPPYADPTPGTTNPDSTTCMRVASVGDCGAAGDLGMNYCTANANSSGAIAQQAATGSSMVVDNDVTLTASSMPINSFGFFLCSRDQGFVANPAGSAGNLCLSGSIGRYVGAGQIQNSGGSGSFELAIDLAQTPQPTGFVSIASGDSWNFQTWFRDSVGGVPTSNFTNGLEIPFL